MKRIILFCVCILCVCGSYGQTPTINGAWGLSWYADMDVVYSKVKNKHSDVALYKNAIVVSNIIFSGKKIDACRLEFKNKMLYQISFFKFYNNVDKDYAKAFTHDFYKKIKGKYGDPDKENCWKGLNGEIVISCDKLSVSDISDDFQEKYDIHGFDFWSSYVTYRDYKLTNEQRNSEMSDL